MTAASPVAQLMQHAEVSMWAEGVDPEVAQRVLNRLLIGRPDAGIGPVPAPWWLDGYARKLADLAHRTIAGVMRDNGEDPADEALTAGRTEQLLWQIVHDLQMGAHSSTGNERED